MSNPNPSPRTRFRPGQSGNSKGRSSLPLVASRIIGMLMYGKLADLEPNENDPLIDVFMKMIVKRALDGEHRFVKIVLDRVDGRTSEGDKMVELYRLIEDELNGAHAGESLESDATRSASPLAGINPASIARPGSLRDAILACLHDSLSSDNDKQAPNNTGFFPANRRADPQASAIDGETRIEANREIARAPVATLGQGNVFAQRNNGCQTADTPYVESQAPQSVGQVTVCVDDETVKPGDLFPVIRKAKPSTDAVEDGIAGASPTPERVVDPSVPTRPSEIARAPSQVPSNGHSPLGDILRNGGQDHSDALSPKGALGLTTRLASAIPPRSRKQSRAQRRLDRKLAKCLS
jgi:hypothetical protein